MYFQLVRDCEVLKSRNLDHNWWAKYSRSIWSSLEALGWIAESGWGLLQSFSFIIFQKNWKINHWCHISHSPSLKSKSRILWVAPESRFRIKDIIHGVAFYFKNICKFNQIRYPKRSLFRVISQKNDTIGYATLIAPVISSKIKPGIFIFLLYTHMGIHCMENLHYYTRDRCDCSIMGCPLVKTTRLYKVGERPCKKHQLSESMACIWCSCSCPPESYVVFSSERS